MEISIALVWYVFPPVRQESSGFERAKFNSFSLGAGVLFCRTPPPAYESVHQPETDSGFDSGGNPEPEGAPTEAATTATTTTAALVWCAACTQGHECATLGLRRRLRPSSFACSGSQRACDSRCGVLIAKCPCVCVCIRARLKLAGCVAIGRTRARSVESCLHGRMTSERDYKTQCFQISWDYELVGIRQGSVEEDQCLLMLQH